MLVRGDLLYVTTGKLQCLACRGRRRLQDVPPTCMTDVC